MGFTDDEKIIVPSEKKTIESSSGKTIALSINEGNPFAQHDYALVVNTFEIEAANWVEEDYALAYHYKDVYSTRNFSQRVRSQMNYYPGMHQSSYVPKEDPAYTKAEEMASNRLNFWNNAMDHPSAFMNGLRSRQQDFDYQDIFGSDTSAKTRTEQLGKVLTECIPCFDRLLDLEELVPNGDLIEVHLLNLNLRTDLLEQIKQLFRDPGMYLDICELLNLLARLCPQDLFAIMALLTQYLAKLNLDIKFNIDFIINLVGAILSPFLDALSQWLDKLVQLLLAPVICVVDHINEIILTAQTMKIPLSEATASIDIDLGSASSGHKNISIETDTGITPTGQWASGEIERFETPSQERYNPQRPEWPEEEVELASEEMRESWNPGFSEEERQERDQQWADLRAKEETKRRKVPPPLKEGNPQDGRRWSKDDIPQSEKWSREFSVGNENHPPEKQQVPQEALKYLDPEPLVNSIVQLRNIMQGAIRYVQDWFDYSIQMIYDLLGTDAGWMIKKTDNTYLKSRIIQLVAMIRAILEAVSKNGLKCGVNSNFDESQMRFILEEGLSKFSNVRFKVLNDGSVQITMPNAVETPDIEHAEQTVIGPEITIDGTDPEADLNTAGVETGIGVIKDTAKTDQVKQKTIESGMIIKNCLRDVTADELTKAKEWIADYERRTGGNG
jgi:hypothetical protein